VAGCPETEQAWRSGEISLAQAREITNTEAARPGSELELLETARTAPLRVLKERAKYLQLTAMDADELRRRQRKARSVRHWTDELGMTRIAAALLPEIGAAVVSRLAAETERQRRQARQTGQQQEPWECHAADALPSLLVGNT